MKEIPLTKDKVAIVDDEFYDELARFKWYCQYPGYAKRADNSTGTRVWIIMHRLIYSLAYPDDNIEGLDIDHIDMNTFNNRVSNLRKAHRHQNSANVGASRNNTSGYKGVKLFKGKWTATLNFQYKRYHLGTYATPEEAAKTYNDKARELLGEFAYINPGVESVIPVPILYHTSKEFKAKGVWYHKTKKKWEACAKLNGKKKFIGNYETESEAIQARQDFIANLSK